MEYIRNSGARLIEELEAEGRIVVTTDETMKRLSTNRKNALAILGRLKHAKKIHSLTTGLYALWHPSERKWGLHPLPILDSLMKHRKTPYYVGLLSAAERYGATHHKPQVLQVIIPKQIKIGKSKKLGLSFHVFKKFFAEGLKAVQISSGPVIYSSPERTVLDLFLYETACGGFNNLCLVIRELLPILKIDDFKKLISVYPYLSCVQKIGYFLEHFGSNKQLLPIIKKWTLNHKLSPISLSSSCPKKGKFSSLWKVIINTSIEEEE
jgi:predicted transcriptional regulator of viral defense system